MPPGQPTSLEPTVDPVDQLPPVSPDPTLPTSPSLPADDSIASPTDAISTGAFVPPDPIAPPVVSIDPAPTDATPEAPFEPPVDPAPSIDNIAPPVEEIPAEATASAGVGDTHVLDALDSDTLNAVSTLDTAIATSSPVIDIPPVTVNDTDSVPSDEPFADPGPAPIQWLIDKGLALRRLRAQKKLDRIMALFNTYKHIHHHTVEKTLRIPHGSVIRYINILEKEGKLRQVGKVGRGVYYEKI